MGALSGAVVGVLVLVVMYLVTGTCLPYLIAEPTTLWPWYCARPTYGLLTYLTFPINVLTNDLASAAKLAPLTLLFYAVIGALLGRCFGRTS